MKRGYNIFHYSNIGHHVVYESHHAALDNDYVWYNIGRHVGY